MTPLTFIWGRVTRSWLPLISHPKTTILLSPHDSPPKCWMLPPFFITVTQQEVFLVLPLEGQQLKLIGLLNKLALSGITSIHVQKLDDTCGCHLTRICFVGSLLSTSSSSYLLTIYRFYTVGELFCLQLSYRTQLSNSKTCYKLQNYIYIEFEFNHLILTIVRWYWQDFLIIYIPRNFICFMVFEVTWPHTYYNMW